MIMYDVVTVLIGLIFSFSFNVFDEGYGNEDVNTDVDNFNKVNELRNNNSNNNNENEITSISK